MRLQFHTFIAIGFTLIFLFHAGLYFSWVKFFHITDPLFKRGLGITILLLSASFICASLLVHRWENFFTGSFYLISGIWLGAFLYITMSVILTWIGGGLSALIFHSAHWRIIGAFFLLCAVGYSTYGLVNAANPVVRYVTVPIKNLPGNWHNRKIVQISDIHLGAINRESFMTRIVAKINKINPDVVFITGDLFDGASPDLNSLAYPLARLKPKLGTYFITGNHETYVGVDKCLKALEELPVRVLRNEIIDLDSIQLVGIEYPTGGNRDAMDATLKRIVQGRPTIALFHPPVGFEPFQESGVNLLLCGHTHVGQMWPFNYITHKVYNNYDYGLHTDGDFSIYTSSGAGTWGPPLRTGNRPEIVVFTLVNK